MLSVYKLKHENVYYEIREVAFLFTSPPLLSNNKNKLLSLKTIVEQQMMKL